MQNTVISDAELTCMISRRGIRPSLLRIAVLSQIANRRQHPTAEEIYKDLSEIYPSFSKTTVYNSLHSLVDGGLIKEVDVESGVRHYDFALQPQHSHFTCRSCGTVFDMEMPAGLSDVVMPGFDVDGVSVTYKGLCPECKKKEPK